LVGLFGGDSPFGALIGIYVATVLTTELITNNAAAALIFPIALSTAQELGVEPMPFIMAIAFGASASFLTPIGYQTNTMVFAVGKYKFTDYFVAGAGLSLLYGVVVVSLIPYFFPF
jgi:di/tricarboxylate transporter